MVQMKKISFLVSILLVLFILPSSASALFASPHILEGTLNTETNVFFIGRTEMRGSFTGFPMEQVVSSSIVQGMGAFPLIGTNTISNLDTVIIAEDIDINASPSLEELILRYYDHITQYSNVDIITDSGVFLLGIQQGNLTISVDLPYAFTNFVPLEILPNTTTRFLSLGTNDPISLFCSGDFAVLTGLSDTGSIEIRNKQGEILWSGGSSNDYIVIQDKQFSIIHQPPLSFFPLNDADSTPVVLSISPANPDAIAAAPLIENISAMITKLGEGTAIDFIRDVQELDTVIQTASFVANGAMVFLQTNDTVSIDQTTQRFSSVGFVRFTTLNVTVVGSSTGPSLRADCSLIFLGDQIYNPQAKRSSDGIAFPYELLLIWILALCAFIYIYFFLRPPVDAQRDRKLKRCGFYIHIAVLIIAFILVDIEVNDLFGVSAFTALFTQGFSLITGVFFLLELLIWILGYLILAIPLQLLSYAVLRVFGVGKGGNGIRKGIGDLSIWVFCGLYLLLFINVIFSFIHITSFFPMG
jgi:hypothetical protein